ncbi:MAG: hypothetical protein M1829_000351 [Trizodia sp. TS-e1964]|nr:MAG: hypothetical protein M1829_000351 [Trizodia sp. TS-e1964]
MSNAATPPNPSEPAIPKLIFAPGANGTLNSQASQFTSTPLSRSSLAGSPLAQFHAWFTSALATVPIPETATLSTATASGRVSARMVYLKELDARGFVVYSNWQTSRKAQDVRENPRAALTFWWREVERQVRVEGPVERLPEAESQVYFDTRARGSRIGAWASRQSTVVDEGEVAREVARVEKLWEGHDRIPVPPFWGGLRLRPEMVEFWQGGDSRLHDRFRYSRVEEEGGNEAGGEEGEWVIERLAP